MKQSRKGINLVARYGLFIVFLLVAAATALWMTAKIKSSYLSFPEAFYSALQFIAVNKVVDETISDPCIRFGLYITQFAIPFFAYITIFTKLFHERVHPFLKRKTVNSYKNHDVIISYGAFGKALANALSGSENKNHGKPQIVAVDKLHTAEHDGESTLTILYYDALRADLFKKANLKSARAVYLMLPDEKENLALLEKIKNKAETKTKIIVYIRTQFFTMSNRFMNWIGIKSKNKPKPKLEVYLRTQSFAMQNLLMDWVGINAFKQDGLDIHVSNPYAIAARGILNRYSLDLYVSTDKSGPVAQVAMVVGTSEMAKAMVLRFARIGTYSPKGKLKLIWVGEGVSDALNDLKAMYPALATDYGDLKYWSLDPEVSKAYFDSVLPPINLVLVDQPAEQAIRYGEIAGADNASWPSAIYVCHNSDIRNLAEARDIQVALCAKPEAARIKTYGNKGRLILAIQNKSVLGIAENQALLAFPYRIDEQSIDTLFAETVVKDRSDELAKGYHAVYYDLKNEKDIDDAWMEMKVYWKESNRDLADHLAIKARYAGIDADIVRKVVLEGVSSISEEDEAKMKAAFDDLVVMEMYRYRAFMFMNNFRYGTHASEYQKRIDNMYLSKPEKELDQCLRVNKTLLKRELPEDECEKDYNIVNQSIEALKKRSNYQNAVNNE